jgi:hypothetical protein
MSNYDRGEVIVEESAPASKARVLMTGVAIEVWSGLRSWIFRSRLIVYVLQITKYSLIDSTAYRLRI